MLKILRNYIEEGIKVVLNLWFMNELAQRLQLDFFKWLF